MIAFVGGVFFVVSLKVASLGQAGSMFLFGAIVVGIPALLGILLAQLPAKLWVERKGFDRRGSAALVVLANVLFTTLVGMIVSSGGIVRSPWGLGVLAALACAASFVWLALEWKFGEADA
jgi:hypothetical protein